MLTEPQRLQVIHASGEMWPPTAGYLTPVEFELEPRRRRRPAGKETTRHQARQVLQPRRYFSRPANPEAG